MPKIRERDPMDKVKTKGAPSPKQKKNPAQISRQIEKAAKEKAEQRREQEASNESAVTTTEQAAIDVTRKAGEITGNVAGAVYDRVLPRQTESANRGHGGETGANTVTPESSAPVSKGRNLAAQKAAQQSNVQIPFEPAHGEIRDMSPKTNRPLKFLPPCSQKPEKCRQKTFQTVQWSKGAGWPFKNTDKPRWKKRRKPCLSCLLIHSHNLP